ncbi:hypothetical protein JG687_00019692 [Phytophthora cactorum]|uniref:RZ-type domain-containing protein n=1 Tax=Phytophthora cactorum TaxID=29920 RepID=A0A8T1TLB5_9STRA|nr:hypothetical protein JG687_00019692 [Phytophthora cactorum]
MALQERANVVAETGDLTRDKTLRHDLQEAKVLATWQSTRLLFPYPTRIKSKALQYARQAINKFEKGSFSMQAGEARLMLVQILLANAEEKLSESVNTETERKTREKAVERFAYEAHGVLSSLEKSAESFLSKHGQDVRDLRQKLLSVVQRARNGTFYQKVSVDEMRAIKTAMQEEFRGSGHWYRCENGHSYSIGECGMAMEETRCPECGAPVGGREHTLVQGSRHDSRMDWL